MGCRYSAAVNSNDNGNDNNNKTKATVNIMLMKLMMTMAVIVVMVLMMMVGAVAKILTIPSKYNNSVYLLKFMNCLQQLSSGHICIVN